MEERGSFRVATIAGIPIRVHYSLILLLPLLALAFAAQLEQAVRSGRVEPYADPTRLMIWAVLASMFLLVAVVLHELGHALVARRYGGRTRSITLWALGGVARIEDGPPRPRHEALMAAAGPAVSLLIAAVCIAAANAMPRGHLGLALFQLGGVNAALAVFNLLPAFPMDGGRVLRSVMAWRLGEPRGTQAAATVGKAFAALFAVVGVLSANFILVLIAIFVWSAGSAEAELAHRRVLLRELRAAQFMSARPETVPATMRVDQAVAHLLSRRRLAAPVLDAGSRLLGMIGPAELDRVPPEKRAELTVGEIAVRDVPVVAPDDTLAEVMEALNRAGLFGVPVVQNGEVVGMIDREDLERAVRLAAAGRREATPGPRPSS